MDVMKYNNSNFTLKSDTITECSLFIYKLSSSSSSCCSSSDCVFERSWELEGNDLHDQKKNKTKETSSTASTPSLPPLMGLSRAFYHRQDSEAVAVIFDINQQQLRGRAPSSNFMAATNNGSKSTDHQINSQHQQHPHQDQLMQDQPFPRSYLIQQQQQPSASPSSSTPGSFTNNKGSTGAYDLGELDQALFLYFDGHDPSSSSPSTHHLQDQPQRQNSFSSMRPPTLNIFPSQPMHVEPSHKNSPPEPSMDQFVNTRTGVTAASSAETPSKPIKREGTRKGTTSSSEQDGPKTPDPKTLRRLAQNREAARKSRLRKKAYIQNLESSRIKLSQLEQELQRARGQGILVGGEQGLPVNMNSISSDAALFNMEYTRWTEEHHRLMCELMAAVQEHLPENELRLFVDNCLAHYDEVITLKSMVAKSDVFHIVSGMWKTPAERCFMWMGGFRPSELIKVILNQIEPLTEQQLLGICGLQQSTQEAEEALSHGLEALNQSLTDTLTSDSLSCPPNMSNYMGQMAVAMNKLSTIEGFVRQADNLRHQTIHRLQHLLTTRQAARCLIAISEYFNRLRALSSLWVTRPRQD